MVRITPHLQAMKRPFARGPTTLLRGLMITMVINDLRPSWDDPPSSSVCVFGFRDLQLHSEF